MRGDVRSSSVGDEVLGRRGTGTIKKTRGVMGKKFIAGRG